MARGNSAKTWGFLAFALPAIQTSLVHGPVGVIVPSIYSTEWGLSLALIGSAIFLSRIFDAAIDPAIGFLSDHTQTRLGRRKPWIVAGAAGTMLATWFLFSPPAHPSVAYFFVWYVAAYFAWTLMEIPHTAWGFEITRDYNERSRVVAYRVLAAGLGGVAFLLLPFLPVFKTTAFTGDVLRLGAKIALVVVPLTTAVAVIWAPEGPPLQKTDRYGLKDLLGLFKGNRPLWLFLGGFFLSGFADGMFAGLAFLYFTNFLGMAKQYPLIGLVQLVATLAFVIMAPAILKRLGRLRAWSISIGLSVLIMGLVLLLPHSPAALMPLLAITVAISLFTAVRGVAVTSVLGDVVDYDTLKSGKKRAAMFTALNALVVKLNTAIGASASLMLVGAFGYQPKLGHANSATAQWGMQLSFVVAPTLIYGLAIAFVLTFPINRRRQAIISRRLEQREARALRLVAASTPGAAGLAAE